MSWSVDLDVEVEGKRGQMILWFLALVLDLLMPFTVIENRGGIEVC